MRAYCSSTILSWVIDCISFMGMILARLLNTSWVELWKRGSRKCWLIIWKFLDLKLFHTLTGLPQALYPVLKGCLSLLAPKSVQKPVKPVPWLIPILPRSYLQFHHHNQNQDPKSVCVMWNRMEAKYQYLTFKKKKNWIYFSKTGGL